VERLDWREGFWRSGGADCIVGGQQISIFTLGPRVFSVLVIKIKRQSGKYDTILISNDIIVLRELSHKICKLCMQRDCKITL
jgi:hypothetical protein